MRQIKFRAWDRNTRKMKCKFTLETLCIMPSFKDSFNDWDIMQYTGLKDKNGKEIYEGDVFISGRLVDKEGGEKTHLISGDVHKTKIEMPLIVERHPENGGYQLKGIRGYSQPFWIAHNDITSKMEVIGNIHENPELL